MAGQDGWYYRAFDTDFGPVTFEELVELAKSHTISHDDQIRLGENGVWRRAGSIGKLMAHLPFKAGSIDLTNSKSDADFDLQSLESSVQLRESNSPLELDMSGLEDVATDNIQDSEPQQIQSGWWCKIKDKEYGPVEYPKIVEWVAAGRLTRNDYVRFGHEPYILAGGLADLFPQAAAEEVVASKPVVTVAEVASAPVADAAKQVAVAAPAKTAPKPSSIPPAKPAAQTPQSAVSMAPEPKSDPIRPAVPSKPIPVAKISNPIDFSRLLLPSGVVGGIAVVGVLIYFGINLVPQISAGDTTAEVARFQSLQKGFGELILARIRGNSNPEALQKAQETMASASRAVLDELKQLPNKSSIQNEMEAFANKLREISEDDLGEARTTNEGLAAGIAESLKKKLRLN